mgnify:CR=1 FL=1
MPDTGGIDGTSFGAGWGAATTFYSALGAFLWRILGGAKNEQIKTLVSRITHLEADMAAERKKFEDTLDDERRRCDAQILGLTDRVKVLEAMTLGAVRQDVQAAISEQRLESRAAPR